MVAQDGHSSVGSVVGQELSCNVVISWKGIKEKKKAWLCLHSRSWEKAGNAAEGKANKLLSHFLSRESKIMVVGMGKNNRAPQSDAVTHPSPTQGGKNSTTNQQGKEKREKHSHLGRQFSQRIPEFTISHSPTTPKLLLTPTPTMWNHHLPRWDRSSFRDPQAMDGHC